MPIQLLHQGRHPLHELPRRPYQTDRAVAPRAVEFELQLLGDIGLHP